MNRARAKLALFVADVFASVPRKDQRAKGDCYLRGLMLDGRRKSIQPMAERLPDGNEQNLQQFVNQSTWDPLPVLRRIAERMVPLIGPEAWAVDDVSFPKDGRMSVAVAHQYCGALGKQANCQVAVSVHAVTDAASCPLQWRLFVPEEWADDTDTAAARPGFPRRSGTGRSGGWPWTSSTSWPDGAWCRRWWWPMPATGRTPTSATAWTSRGIGYVVAVRADVTVHPHDARPTAPPWSGTGRRPQPRYRDKPSSVAALAAGHGRQAFTEVTWREGSRGPMRSRFLGAGGAAGRDPGPPPGPGRRHRQDGYWDGVLPEVTLLVEWPAGAEAPTDYWLSSLPADTPLAELVRLAKIRWRIEHDYRELKHGLGLDHFEGRSWTGWHHHVTLVTAAHAFLTEQRLAPKAHTAD